MEKRWRLTLLALMALLGIFLVSATKPWDAKLLKSIEKREAADKLWKVSDYATYYLWYAAAANFLIAGGLLATTRWWARPEEASRHSAFDRHRLKGAGRRWFWAGVGAAVVLGSVYRVPRLDHSLWNDEEYAFRNYVWGSAVEAPDGGIDFTPVTWEEAFFRNKINNHIVCTVGARLSHSVWKAFAGEEAIFSEAAVRVLPLLMSLGSIAAVALLLARIGAPVAGVAAAFFLALDPWHIRYSVEMRGYAYVLLFITLSLLMLLRAMGTGRWRDWLGYGFLQLLCFLCFPGIVFELAMQNGIALGILLWRKENPWRLVVANLLAGMAALQVFLPSLPQALYYLAHTDEHIGGLTFSWIRDWWSHAVEGIPWSAEHPDLHLGSNVQQEAARNPAAYWEVSLIVPLLALAGLIYAILRHRIILLIVAALLGGSGLALLNAVRSNTVFYSWYVIYSVIAVAILAVLGVEAIARLNRRRPFETIVALEVLFITLYALISTDARYRIVRYERQPLRQAVETVRGESPAFSDRHRDLLTASFGTSRGMIQSYDPRNIVIKSAAEFDDLVARARREKKPLFVYHCGYHIAKTVPEDKDIQKRIETSGEFERTEYIKGLEELFSYHIYRLKPEE